MVTLPKWEQKMPRDVKELKSTDYGELRTLRVARQAALKDGAHLVEIAKRYVARTSEGRFTEIVDRASKPIRKK